MRTLEELAHRGFHHPLFRCIILSYTKKPMDYETDINIRQYSADGTYHFTLKVTDVMNMDYYYDGSAPTLEDVMGCIKIFLKNHQN